MNNDVYIAQIIHVYISDVIVYVSLFENYCSNRLKLEKSLISAASVSS